MSALVVTATGSAHPVNKSQITEAHLAVVKSNENTIFAIKIDDIPCQSPSSESFEMLEMDKVLPRIELIGKGKVPIARSKLHGHRGIVAYHPRLYKVVTTMI